MNKVLIIDASETDGRIMSRLLIRAGYDPVKADNIETGRIEAAKLPPGAVIVTALRLSDGWKSHSTLTLLAKQNSPLWP